MIPVEFVGGLVAYNEAIATQLAACDPGSTAMRRSSTMRVAVVHCDSDGRWEQLARFTLDPDCITVAVLPTLELDHYIRALSLGASGVVYLDMPSAITADVVQSAIHGEVVLPRQAAQNLALLAKREPPVSELSDTDTALLRAVASGRTIVELAEELHYSERTVRRHLQNVYIKLGVRNRTAAIATAARLGITD